MNPTERAYTEAERVKGLRTCDGCAERKNVRLEPESGAYVCAECWPDLWDEFIVIRGVGYPDPFRPHPNTLDNARRFAAEHRREPEFPARVMKRRVSSWEAVE